MPNIPYGNPLKFYVDPTTPPGMSVNGISINKSYGYVGVIDSLNSQSVLYSSPQSTQIIPSVTTRLPNGKNNNSQQKYWESPYDSLGSKDITAVQINLKVPSTSDITFFNHLSFDFADVPANWSIYYLDPITGIIKQLTNSDGYSVGGTTIGLQGYKNGNKLGWVHIEVDTQPIGSTLIELRFDRNVNLNLRPQEVNPFANNIGYPFLLKNFNLKLNATGWNQVPATANIITKNQLGFTENYVITQKDSSQIQLPSNRSNEISDKSKYWRSEPQPVGDAVVDLYTDLGSAQTIDSIYLDPLYTGIQCNIYYSNDTAVNDVFYCSRASTQFTQQNQANPITFNSIGQQTYGPFSSNGTGANFPSTGSAGLITPNKIKFDGSTSWAIGFKYAPNPNMPTGSTTYTLINQKIGLSSSIKVYYQNTSGNVTFKALINGYSTLTVTPTPITSATGWVWYGIIISYDTTNADTPKSSIYVDNHTVNYSSASYTGPIADYTNIAQDAPITIGNDNIPTANNPAYGTIKDIWIRQDTLTPAIINSYFTNPRLFINANGPANTLRGDYRALLMSRLNENYCYYLPSAEYYEAKQWTPIPSDITLRKATFRVPVFNARYVKLEFTNLAGRVYPLAEGAVNRKTKFFPDNIKNYFQTLESYIQNLKTNNYAALSTKGTSSFSFITNGSNLSPNTAFGSAQNQLTSPFTQGELNNNSIGSGFNPAPNAMTSIIDPTSSLDNLEYIDGTPNIGNTSQPTSFLKLRFPQSGTHTYKEKLIMQTWNKAYFVGLKAINFYKTNQDLKDDSEYYYDTCSIQANAGGNGTIFSNSGTTFTYNGNFTQPYGYVSNAIGNTLSTVSLDSFDNVSSIQLATVASDWLPVAPLDQAMLLNSNTSYLAQGTGTLSDGVTPANVNTPSQISTFNLSTGVYSFNPITPGQIYGTANFSSSLPSGLSGSNILGLRASAVARIFLPETNNGTYELRLWGYSTTTSSNILLSSRSFNVPLRSWTTLQIPYSVNDSSITKLQTEIVQTNTSTGFNETFYLTMLSSFYNPIGWSWSIDGTTWFPITTAINNPYAFSTFNSPASSFKIRAKAYAVGVYVKALLIRPRYQQNPYTSQVTIDYFSDPRTNEVGSKVAPVDHPMFKLNSNYYPDALSLTNTSINWTYG